jgi:hypothetical protein
MRNKGIGAGGKTQRTIPGNLIGVRDGLAGRGESLFSGRIIHGSDTRPRPGPGCLPELQAWSELCRAVLS